MTSELGEFVSDETQRLTAVGSGCSDTARTTDSDSVMSDTKLSRTSSQESLTHPAEVRSAQFNSAQIL